MKRLIVIGALVCIAGFLAFALPTAWVDWKQAGDIQQTVIEVTRIPQWLGPAGIALGVMLMLIGSTLYPRKY
jgi:hypothetical protein